MRNNSEQRDIVEVTFLQPDRPLLDRLLPVARRVFTNTFAHLFEPTAFERFCEDVYCPGGLMSGDFDLPEISWKVALVDHEPIGYAKLTPLRAPAPDPGPQALEMQQLYVVHEWHGK